MKNWKRHLIRFFGLLVVAYLAACGYLWASQTQLIFDPVPERLTDPGRMGMAYESVEVPLTSDGEQILLDGTWIPAKQGEPTNSAPSVLYLHGQDSTIGKNLEHDTRQLHNLGYNVLQVDYRGFGKSFDTYKPSEKTVYEDAEAAWQFLIADRGADPKQVIIFGHSLGAAIAIELALHHPEAAGLIVESAFTSILDMSKERYGGAPALLPMGLLISHRFESKDKIGKLELPLLLIHGTEDVKIRDWMGKQLYGLAPEPKELLLIEGGEHANCASIGAVEFKEKVSAFVEKYTGAATGE